MRKITLLLILLTVSFGFSQSIENFEGAGAMVPTFAPDNGECTVIGMEISTTQASTGGTKSLEIIAQAAGNPWQGAQVILQSDLNLTTNLLVDVDVYSTVPAGILAKVTDGTGPDAAGAANHTGSGWETLQFNMADAADTTTEPANGDYPVIRFYPLWGQAGGYAGQGSTPCVSDAPITIYVDNMQYGSALSTKDFKITGLSMYPNPTQDSWNIKTQKVEMTAITVFDVLGKSVLSMTPKSSEVTIEARSLRTGLYFAKIETANGSQTVKLIKK